MENYWSRTTLWEKLVKMGAKVVTHLRRVIFQMMEEEKACRSLKPR